MSAAGYEVFDSKRKRSRPKASRLVTDGILAATRFVLDFDSAQAAFGVENKETSARWIAINHANTWARLMSEWLDHKAGATKGEGE